MAMTFPEHPTEFCITDVGSTTTKALLFQRDNTGWRFFRREVPTTVEKPSQDVTVGVIRALRELERETGATLITDGEPVVPYLSTSSAGGGLAMVVTGLVRDVTSRSAQTVALGAGAILLDVIAMDDGRTPYEKIHALKTVRPDMILLAGGFDGDAIAGPVFLAELIRESGLRPKLSRSAALPVVYAGNVHAQDFARQTLGDGFLFHAVPNIRPAGDRENLEPAREAIHDLFMDHVMSHAPGYERLITWVSAPIAPTPAAFGKILGLASRELGLRILAVDIGGATTDVFTAEAGVVSRTVSANLGMSYSILNVAQRAGIGAVLEILGLEQSEEYRWDQIGNKHVRPTSLPSTAEQMNLEWATAAVAIREAVKDHRRVLDGVSLSRERETLSIRRELLTGPTRRTARSEEPPLTEGYDLIIGSGGILSHSPRDAAAMMLVNGLRPSAPISLAVDRAFMFPHLGVLSEVNPELAVQLFQELGLVRLGSYMPIPGTKGCRVRGDTDTGRSFDEPVTAGTVCALSLGAEERARVSAICDERVVWKSTRELQGGECGLITDTRALASGGGEPQSSHHGSGTMLLRSSVIKPPAQDVGSLQQTRVYRGKIRLRRELAIPGTVYVNKGSIVEPETVIARSKRQFLRPFYLDIASSLKIGPDQLLQHLLKNIGDEIEDGDVLARRKVNPLTTKKFMSPVSGTLERILPTGTLVVREKPEDAMQYGTATVARDLGIRPEQIKPYVRVEEGQLVEKGQAVAVMMRPGDMRYSRSPMRGKVVEINHKYGIIHIVPLLEELEIQAWLPGRVAETTTRGCLVEGEGIRIEGIWGTGGEVSGTVSFDSVGPGRILFREAATSEDLRRLVFAGGTGLVTGSLHLKDILDSCPAITVVLTEEFGEKPMAPDLWKTFEEHDGKLVLLDGTTELRVGVRRPAIILPRPV